MVTGSVGIGKSTLCARLAGTIPGAVLLDADIFAEDLVSVAPPNDDYVAFWRSMLRLAHELAQSNVVVVYFSVMRPEQLLANSDILGYFDSVRFLCLTCSANVLRARLARREPGADPSWFERWVEFNSALAADASALSTADVVDAGRAVDQVEHDVRDWIKAQLQRRVLSPRTQPSEPVRPCVERSPFRLQRGSIPAVWDGNRHLLVLTDALSILAGWGRATSTSSARWSLPPDRTSCVFGTRSV